MEGQIKWFDKTKGFGFITQDNGNDIFVHHSELGGKIAKDGDRVKFDVGDGRKGPCATNVEFL